MIPGRIGLLTLLLLASNVAGITAQTVHEIDILGNRDRGQYRFDPAEVSVRAGDVLRFQVVSGAPHSVVFDSSGMSARDRSALDAAITDRMSLLSGPLMTDDGQVFDVRVPRLSPGTYRFYCLPHRAYRAEGVLVVGDQ